MDLHLTSEQTLLRDSAAKFIGAAGPKAARGFREQDPSFAPARLRQAGELGWLGILVPDAADGLGLGLTELGLVLEQVGRGLVCEPNRLRAQVEFYSFSRRSGADQLRFHFRKRNSGRFHERVIFTAVMDLQVHAVFERDSVGASYGLDGQLVTDSAAAGGGAGGFFSALPINLPGNPMGRPYFGPRFTADRDFALQ